MALEQAKKYLTEKGYADRIIELEESSATVQLAAETLGVEPGMIAKTMSFLVDREPILILTEGTAKVDNRKYKDQFHVKAKMIPFDEVERYIGHAPGGVCPFGIKDGIKVYLDESLNRFEDGAEVTVESLLASSAISKAGDGVKILGNGELTKKLTVKVNAVSETAKEKIEAAGGTVELI